MYEFTGSLERINSLVAGVPDRSISYVVITDPRSHSRYAAGALLDRVMPWIPPGDCTAFLSRVTELMALLDRSRLARTDIRWTWELSSGSYYGRFSKRTSTFGGPRPTQ